MHIQRISVYTNAENKSASRISMYGKNKLQKYAITNYGNHLPIAINLLSTLFATKLEDKEMQIRK